MNRDAFLGEMFKLDVNAAEICANAKTYFDEHTQAALTLAQAIGLNKKRKKNIKSSKAPETFKKWPHDIPVTGEAAFKTAAKTMTLKREKLIPVPEMIPIDKCSKNVQAFFQNKLFDGIVGSDTFLNLKSSTVIPYYKPYHPLDSMAKDHNHESRDRGVDRGLLRSLPAIVEAWSDTALYENAVKAKNELIRVANSNIRTAGTLFGQLQRISDANKAAAIYTKSRVDIDRDQYWDFLTAAFPLGDAPLAPLNVSYTSLFEDNLAIILSNLNINYRSDAGPVWEGLKNSDVLIQDLYLSYLLYKTVIGGRTIKELAWTRLFKTKPKSEVYSEGDIADEKKTRNYYAGTPAVYKPVQYFYKALLKTSPPGYEDQSMHLLGFSPYNGGLNRLVQHFLKADNHWCRAFSDNLYAKFSLRDGNKKLVDHAWVSIDGKKMESCATKERLRTLMQYACYRNDVHKSWETYCADFYPETCIDFAGLMYQSPLHVKGLASGTLATGLTNTMGILDFIYLYQQDNKFGWVADEVKKKDHDEDDLIQIGDKYYKPVPDFFESQKKAGLKLTIESAVTQKQLLNLSKDEVAELDLLGQDCTVLECPHRVYVPLLNRGRLDKALIFAKEGTDPSLPIAYSLSKEFAKMQSLWLAGAWFYPGIREIVWSKQHELAGALTKSFVRNDEIKEYWGWLLDWENFSEDQSANELNQSQLEGVINTIAGIRGPMSMLSVWRVTMGDLDTADYVDFLIASGHKNDLPLLMTYAEYIKYIGDVPVPKDFESYRTLLESQDGSNIVLNLDDPELAKKREKRKTRLLALANTLNDSIQVPSEVIQKIEQKAGFVLLRGKTDFDVAPKKGKVTKAVPERTYEKWRELAYAFWNWFKAQKFALKFNHELYGSEANVEMKMGKKTVKKYTEDEDVSGVRELEISKAKFTTNKPFRLAFMKMLSQAIPYSDLKSIKEVYENDFPKLLDQKLYDPAGLTLVDIASRFREERIPELDWIITTMSLNGFKLNSKFYTPQVNAFWSETLPAYGTKYGANAVKRLALALDILNLTATTDKKAQPLPLDVLGTKRTKEQQKEYREMMSTLKKEAKKKQYDKRTKVEHPLPSQPRKAYVDKQPALLPKEAEGDSSKKKKTTKKTKGSRQSENKSGKHYTGAYEFEFESDDDELVAQGYFQEDDGDDSYGGY